jgi:competence ComEA-like helix-hairpin-helix protein
VVDSTTYSRLKPYINIKPTNAERKAEENTSEINAQTIYIELNSADTLQIIKVNGLGKTFARRIVAYRELIGGFNSINQLAEVWGINSELVQKLSTQIWVDSTKIKTINLNLISYEDLKKNPYLTEYQAKGIIYYRNKVKTISSPDDLLQQKIITLDRYKKIRPYLRVN